MQVPKNFIPEPFNYHDEIELRVESLTNLGVGIGRVDNWVVMVPFVVPGELVKARIYRNHSQYSDADLIEIIEPSKNRQDARCTLFTQCGGCQYQHIKYDEQLRIKTSQVQELMDKNGGINHTVQLAKSTEQIYEYRSKITPHYNKPDREGKQPIGFLLNGKRHAILDVEQCPIATKAINKALPELRQKAIQEGGRKRRIRGGTLLIRDTLEGIITDPKATVSEKVGSNIFHFKAGEFFQNNPFILPHMVEYVKSAACGEGIENLVDAYCGVGLFALSCSDNFASVTGIEISEAAIQLAKANADILNIDNVCFQSGKAEAIFNHITYPGDATSVVIDPPRKGCDLSFIEQLITFKPRKIIYVSCDPATQARDLKYFVEKSYKLLELQPFDLFPHTRHIENIAILECV